MDALSAGMHRRSHTKSALHQRATQWLLRAEGTRLARYESRVFDYFDACTIISQNDRLLIQHRDRDRIELIPNGVDLEAFAPTPKVADKSDPVILFTGNMSYPPNVDAARHWWKTSCRWCRIPTVRHCPCGAESKPSLKALASDRVTVTGWVDDIVEVYNKPPCLSPLCGLAQDSKTKCSKPWPRNCRASSRPMPSPRSTFPARATPSS